MQTSSSISNLDEEKTCCRIDNSFGGSIHYSFRVLVDEECLFNLRTGIPVNNLLANKILQNEELGKKRAFET